MDTLEYKIKRISGIFKSRQTKIEELQVTCSTLGEQGWELVSVNYDWFMVSYTLFLKRIKPNIINK